MLDIGRVLDARCYLNRLQFLAKQQDRKRKQDNKLRGNPLRLCACT